MTFTIAIVGRPNVGKSTLFNRLIGKQMALVDDTPGVTRDWREGEGELFDLHFRALDTAGLEDVRTKGTIAARTAQQTKLALGQTDIILFIVDARAGLTNDDKAIAREVRKTGKPIILIANKCEGQYLPSNYGELTGLGFGEGVPISASHGEGLAELYEDIKKYAPADAINDENFEKSSRRKRREAQRETAQPKKAPPAGEPEDIDDLFEEPEEIKSLHIAIVGRPNVGKSTLINRLVGEERMLTGPEPGLTRDAIPIGWEFNGRPVRLVDTAGMRRRARVTEKLEKMSVHETLRAIRLSHVVVLVVDANQPLDKQDLVIAHHVTEEGRALVLAVNKWDSIKDKRETLEDIREKAESSLSQVSGLPIIPLSALEGDGINGLINAVLKIYDTWNIRISTSKLNRWLGGMQENHPPPIVSGRRVKMRYMTQIKSRPPTFLLWVNKPVDLPGSYQRFLTNGLRDFFKLTGVPIRWQLRKGDNPYLDKPNKK